MSLSSKNYVVYFWLIQENNNKDHKDIWQDAHLRAFILWQPCHGLSVASYFRNFCFLFRDELVMKDSSHRDILVNYFIYFISRPFAALQSFAALYYAAIWLLPIHHNSFRASPKHLKPENCVSPSLFHPWLLKDRACLVFLSCLCLWHFFLLHPLFQAKGLQISLTHVPKEVHFHFLIFPDSNHPFPQSAISFL